MVGKTARATTMMLVRGSAPGPWKDTIEWYPLQRFYSRRELASDFLVHAVGILLAAAGNLLLALRLWDLRPPPEIVGSVALYGFTLLAMISCSAVYNSGQVVWKHRAVELSQADHAGIVLLIVGTYTPLMACTCAWRLLSFVWAVGVFDIAAKASRGWLDRLPLHVVCFLLMGWSVLIAWESVAANFSRWACQMFVTGGVLYTVGLVPWGIRRLEGHVAIWHVFVIAASSAFFSVVYTEVCAKRRGAVCADSILNATTA